MSSASKASLDRERELTVATERSSSTAHTLSDDDLELFSLSGPSSELGDEPWDAFDDDNGNEHDSPFLDPIIEHDDESPATPAADLVEHPALLTSVALSAADNDEQSEDPDLTMSGIQASEDSSTNSTFSFHFPDPLDKSLEDDTYARLCEPQNESQSEAETESLPGSDILERDEPNEREATIIPPTPSFATPPRSRSMLVTYVSFPFRVIQRAEGLTIRRFGSGIALFAVLIACVIWNPPHFGSAVLLSNNPTAVEALSIENAQSVSNTPAILSTAVRPDVTIAPLVGAKEQLPGVSAHERRPLMLEAPPSSGFFIGSLDATFEKGQPTALPLFSLSDTYQTFVKIIFKDLQDVLDATVELLLFIRGHIPVEPIQQHSRTVMDYLADKVAERHERAKHNARILREKTMLFAKVASEELALRQETAVENAKHVWNEVKKWRR
jgi:hypothetical protein